MEDPSWQRNCELLARSLQSLDKKTATIRRSANKLLSVKDIQKEREKVTQAASTANSTDVQSIQEQLRLVEHFLRLNPVYNCEGVKLMNEAQTALHNYQFACDNFYKKCIALEGSARRQSSKTARTFADDSDDETEKDALLHKERAQKTEMLAFEDSLYQELMAERVRETQEISNNVRDIYEIFEHINEMVGEQGVQLEIVDANVSTAERATGNASRQLQLAQRYQESSCRNKALLIFVLVMFFLVCVALIF